MWKIALRTLARDKGYALINVAGLAIAIACCLILGVYLRSELTYDHSHENYKRIFRVANEFEINGKHDAFARTSTKAWRRALRTALATRPPGACA